MKKFLLALLAVGSVSALTACSGDDFEGLTFQVAFGNTARTMTYQKATPLVMPDGTTTVSLGQLKPTWQLISDKMGVDFRDDTNQSQTATDMITTASLNGFKTSNIYGGNSIGEDLMNYGQKGYFVNLAEELDKMPNFEKFLTENPEIAATMTTYTGGIYHIPYTAEIGEIARAFHVREDWVTKLFADGAVLDTTTTLASNSYSPVYETTRTSEPIDGTEITKKTTDNIIDLQDAAGTANGKVLTETLLTYIKNNYNYTNPSELYLGANAAYDMDELVALLRCVKTNPNLLTDNKATTVTPLFVRQSDYRDDLLRLTTYFYGERAYGSDSYASRFYLDKDGNLDYSYSQAYMYNTLTRLQEMNEEGLIYGDTFNVTVADKTNWRTPLYASDSVDNPQFGFMTYDWINSTTAANESVATVLPPVAEINGEWQYFLDNSRVVKPDGWAISINGSTSEEIDQALELFDYMFSDEGNELVNYGFGFDEGANAMVIEMDEDDEDTYFQYVEGGDKYPLFNEWMMDTATEVSNGDVSTFLRDWVGSLMAVGFVKTIGGVAQTDSANATAGTKLLMESTTNIPTYAGLDKNTDALPTGTNPNYFKLAPPIFSMTTSQIDKVAEIEAASLTEEFYNSMYTYIFGGTVSSGYDDEDAYTAMWKAANVDTYLTQYSNAYNSVYKKEE